MAEAIKNKVETCGKMVLSCDYQATGTLCAVARETSINQNAFPWKTTMWIEKDKITVRDGDGAPEKLIFQCEE